MPGITTPPVFQIQRKREQDRQRQKKVKGKKEEKIKYMSHVNNIA